MTFSETAFSFVAFCLGCAWLFAAPFISIGVASKVNFVYAKKYYASRGEVRYLIESDRVLRKAMTEKFANNEHVYDNKDLQDFVSKLVFMVWIGVYAVGCYAVSNYFD